MSPQWTATPWLWKERGGKGVRERRDMVRFITVSVKLLYMLHWPALPVLSYSLE